MKNIKNEKKKLLIWIKKYLVKKEFFNKSSQYEVPNLKFLVLDGVSKQIQNKHASVFLMFLILLIMN